VKKSFRRSLPLLRKLVTAGMGRRAHTLKKSYEKIWRLERRGQAGIVSRVATSSPGGLRDLVASLIHHPGGVALARSTVTRTVPSGRVFSLDWVPACAAAGQPAQAPAAAAAALVQY
jgi:hypothetical protein